MNLQDRVGPHPLAFTQAGIEPPALPDPAPDSSRGQTRRFRNGLDLGAKMFGCDVHVDQPSVKYHTRQGEASHSLGEMLPAIRWSMEINETFRQALKAARLKREMGVDELALAAKMNRRAVRDIEEGRSQSPKIETVFKLAEALGVDPGELLGLGPRYQLNSELAAFLAQYDEADQARFLAALAAFPLRPAG